MPLYGGTVAYAFEISKESLPSDCAVALSATVHDRAPYLTTIGLRQRRTRSSLSVTLPRSTTLERQSQR